MYGEGSPMAQVVSSRYYRRPIPSQSHRDVTEERYRDLRHPRRVRFYCNGDRYFRGKKLYITPHRYLSFNDLLGDLTSKLPKTVPLPYGVRQIYTPVGGRRVQEIEELQDGEAYVCAGFEPFKSIRYGRDELEPWTTAVGAAMVGPATTDAGRVPNAGNQGEGNYGTQSPGAGAYNYGFGAFRPNRHLRQTYPNRRSYGTFGTRKGPASYWGTDKEPGAGGVKPKVVTVVRNGPKPRNNVKILLNRRSVQSFEQMVLDIAEAFGPKWKNSRVRKLYTVRGKEVQAVSDFFRDDDLFIAVGNETMTKGDILDMLDELYPDSSYAKNLAKEWDKARKKRQNAAYRYKGDDDLGPDEVKRDSGLGSDASNRDERDEIVHLGKPDYKPKKHKKLPYMKDGDLMMRIEKERLRAAEEERERARRRLQKRLEAERRALDEERRKRGLVPIGPVHDPFKKMQEEKEKEREKERQRREEEEARLEEEERERLEEERKMQASPKKVKPFEAPKVIVVVKDDNGDQSGRSSEVRKSRKDQDADSDTESRSRSRSKKEKRKKSRETESRTGESDKENRTSRKSYDGYEADDDDSHRRKGTATDENANKTKDDEKNANDEDIPPKKEKRKKSKSKVVHKTKLERQISNADHVLEKYVAGKTLGDGNFAIVKQCTLRGTSNEYAMKIVDKSKLKGKEHMIENEIAIMKQCSHPNIVKLVEEFETKSEIYLIMELVKGGDLFDAITQSVKFNESDSAGMVRDLCNALFYLHSRKIVHRDLKPENLLVCRNKDGSITLKLADFGLAMDVTEPIYTVCGTPTYVAPEILSEIGYGLEVDMWATGVISYILLCGFPPFRSPDRNQTELFEFIKAGEYEFLSPYWDNISKAAKDMIERLLVVDKKKRYTSVDTLCHPWIITHGGKSHPPDNMESYRKNQRRNLEAEAKMNLESYQRNKHG